MAIAGLSEKKNRAEAVEATLREMEALGKRMRELIAAQPPLELLGFIYGEKLCKAMNETATEQGQRSDQVPQTDVTQFLLEYVHAVLASTPTDGARFDEAAGVELFECARILIEESMLYAIVSTGDAENISAYIQFQAKSNWVSVRGNRYQVLEGEFYSFVLEPHNSAFQEAYGIDANEIASGFQQIANALRSGHADACEAIANQINTALDFSESEKIPFDEAASILIKNNSADKNAAILAYDDMMLGGICNVSPN